MLQLVALLQSWADQAQLNMTITIEMAYAFIALCSALGISGFTGIFYLLKPKAQSKLPSREVKEEITSETKEVEAVEEVAVAEEVAKAQPVPTPVPEKSWKERLTKGLSSSRNGVWGKIGSLFGAGGLDEDALEEVEELLYGADLGPKATSELIESLEEKAKSADFDEAQFKIYIKEFLKNKMADVQSRNEGDLFEFKGNATGMPKVIMIVGVNGAGKTTTIGKLATKLTQQGAKVVVGACDTFRAAAVDQLQVWCERAGATMIRAKEGANPSGVGYDALQTAINEKADYCILDTAGRLHTAGNLMEELTKSKNVLKKLMADAPHHTLLVIDAITGQNAIRQAEEFHKALDLTGLVFTKCDGSSKAGSAISIVDSLQIPITYIGVGENVEDLSVFNLDEYLDALVGN
ncbi:signal recognition particle-docking protein FtsY [Halobacteriovorax sp. XZX-3]|uniref:signal recognition particle-docking protein FtsY n=1 Tax=unclassified Halobacteriovorax TaxID=2639665 RepID=UPI00371C6027